MKKLAVTKLSSANKKLLVDMIKQEISDLERLLQMLDQEYALLADKRADAFQQVVQQKQKQVGKLQLISQQREQLMTGLGLLADKARHEPSEMLFDNVPELDALWRKLISFARQCRHRNRINGSIVDSVSRQTHQALEILRGAVGHAGQGAALYDQSGHTTASGAIKRPITQV